MLQLLPLRVENGRHDFEHALDSFHRDINRLFEDFSRGFDLPFWGRAERGHDYISPRVDLSEDEKEIRFTVELPGMDEKDFEVVVSDNVLTIKGEKREMKEEKDRHYTYMELLRAWKICVPGMAAFRQLHPSEDQLTD